MDRTFSPDEIVRALMSGALAREDLTARGLAKFLGKTTGHVYHAWGSLEGLLIEVVEAGFGELGARLTEVFLKRGDLSDVAEAFVAFGLDHPSLFYLMFEYRFDWPALREAGAIEGVSTGLSLFHLLAGRIGAEETRILYAGLVGLVSLASSGRANVAASHQADREVALSGARKLVSFLCNSPTKEKRNAKHLRSLSTPEVSALQPHRQERNERATRKKRRPQR